MDELAAPERGRFGQEGRSENRPLEFLTRAVRELRKPLSDEDIKTEEAMHLGR